MMRKIILILFILIVIPVFLYGETDPAPVTDSLSIMDFSPTEYTDDMNSMPVSIEEGLAKKISLDLRGIELTEVFKFLAKKGNLNIVTSNEVTGRVTLLLNDVSIKDIVDVILLTNKMAYYEDRDIITIMSESEYEALYGEKYNDRRTVSTINLKYADATKVGTVLGDLKSTIGKVIMDEGTGSIILIDVPEKIEKMVKTAMRFDVPTVNRVIPTITEVFDLQHATVDGIKEEITAALTENIGTIRSDTRTNKLVVSDLPHNMKNIREIVKAFDSRPKQVFIESKMIEVTLDDDFYMGVDWKALFEKIHNMTFDHNFPSSYTGSNKLDVDFGVFNGSNYEIALDFIKSVGDTRIISSPHIAVCDGEEAKFMVGSREAYVTTTTTTGEVTTTTSESVQFIDVGVNLYVTPTISSNGYVKMQIKPEISSVSSWLETTEGNEIPIVDTSNVETEILVKDGTTIVLAGLIKETNSNSRDKIPILGDMPILGALFGNTKIDKRREELVIFLTPHIITGEEDYFYTAEDAGKKRKPLK